MTTATPTKDDLVDERVTLLNEADDIINTAKELERSTFEDAERTRLDEIKTRIVEIDEAVAADAIERSDAGLVADINARRFDVPNIARAVTPAHEGRSLDELLWATADKVQAGSLSRSGVLRPQAGAYNDVERVVVRSVEENTLTRAPRITDFGDSHRHAIRNLQRTVSEMCLFGMMVDKEAKNSGDGFQVARAHRLFVDEWTHICRALDVDTAGEGGAWVPTGIGADLHEKVRAAGKVATVFQRIDLPTNPWKFPIEGADATAYLVAEPTSDTATKVAASTPGTVAATFDAEIFGGRVLFSRSLEADSALAILPFTQRKMVQAFVDAEEKAILDGDADGTHQDSDTNTAGATSASWAWDGLRKKAIAQTLPATGQTTTSVANLILLRKAMGKWGVNPADLVYVVGVSALHTLLGDTNLLTVDKMGSQATILNGMIGSVAGVPVVVSEHVRENLNASGVHDAITTTKTYNLCVNRNEWVMGQRSALDVEVDDSIYRESYQRVVVGFMREDFQHIGDAATNEDTAIAYNITP